MQNVIIIIIFLPLHCHLSICSSVTIYSHISQRDFVDFRCCCCGRCWWCWRCFVVEFNAIVIAAAQTSHRTSRVPQPESSAPLSLSLSLPTYRCISLYACLSTLQPRSRGCPHPSSPSVPTTERCQLIKFSSYDVFLSFKRFISFVCVHRSLMLASSLEHRTALPDAGEPTRVAARTGE